MTFILLFGPPSVGKMTVGYELARRTGLKLFHNHMTIELVLNFFDFTDPAFGRLDSMFRQRIFDEVAESDLPGLIFTYVWALDQDSDKAFVDRTVAIFENKGAEICYVELEADQGERLRRNATEFRLSQKPSKRNVTESEKRLLAHDAQYRFNSDGDFFYPDRHFKINNTDLSAKEVARRIMDRFGIDEREAD